MDGQLFHTELKQNLLCFMSKQDSKPVSGENFLHQTQYETHHFFCAVVESHCYPVSAQVWKCAQIMKHQRALGEKKNICFPGHPALFFYFILIENLSQVYLFFQNR